jgi:hypothetical protein
VPGQLSDRETGLSGVDSLRLSQPPKLKGPGEDGRLRPPAAGSAPAKPALQQRKEKSHRAWTRRHFAEYRQAACPRMM